MESHLTGRDGTASSIGGTGHTASCGRSSATSSTSEVGLGGREEASKAVGLAFCECVGVGLGTIALVALCGAFVGGSSLGRVGTSNSLASGLAGHIGRVAVLDTADGRAKAGLGSRSAGNGGRLLGQGEDAGGESKDGDGVLHGECSLVWCKLLAYEF